MKKLKLLALSLLLATPMVINAAGMGVYIPFNLTETENIDYDLGGSNEFEYKPSAGFGIAFDSNIGQDKLYNYRLGLEYSSAELDTVDGQTLPGTLTKDKFNIVNTFGFGVLRTKTVRLWVGPRINIQFENGVYDDGVVYVEQDSFGIGLAAAAGVNVNLGRLVSLSADLDYHAVSIAGTEDGTVFGIPFSDDYTGTNKGVTARFYVLFRFGKEFQKPAAQSADQGVVDPSL
ncbi:MAG: hypothetical protein WBF77_05350 [Sulfurimonadaceae bacterium]